MFTIVGGTYHELCQEPKKHEFYGSGLRAAVALSNHGFDIYYKSCIGINDLGLANQFCNTFGINPSFEIIEDTITFSYNHPLSRPLAYPNKNFDSKIRLTDVTAENVLYYGQIEATVKVVGEYVVYDPQNKMRFRDTGSSAQHLALVLNRQEAVLMSGKRKDEDLRVIGKSLLESEAAEIVVIKNGSKGALVIEQTGIQEIPVFETESVWPIGSGDIFSAVFAWKWILEKLPAGEAALLASKFTAYYCEYVVLPLPLEPKSFNSLPIREDKRRVYLAGPFFSIAEKWLIEELRSILLEFDNEVFSPLHDVGPLSSTSEIDSIKEIVDKDLSGIVQADVLLAVITGLDPGTLFEIGYARALDKKVVVFYENVSKNDLTMLQGSDCILTQDLSTAIYKSSW